MECNGGLSPITPFFAVITSSCFLQAPLCDAGDTTELEALDATHHSENYAPAMVAPDPGMAFSLYIPATSPKTKKLVDSQWRPIATTGYADVFVQIQQRNSKVVIDGTEFNKKWLLWKYSRPQSIGETPIKNFGTDLTNYIVLLSNLECRKELELYLFDCKTARATIDEYICADDGVWGGNIGAYPTHYKGLSNKNYYTGVSSNIIPNTVGYFAFNVICPQRK